MALNYPVQGESSAAAYQIAATPFVTSSTVNLGQIKEVDFQYVTRFFVVRNTSETGTIAVSFTENGLTTQNSNFFTLNGTESFSGELRTDRLFVSGVSGNCNFSVIGGLTLIPEKMLTKITGSNGFPGVG